uniref:uncharacterized protein LOC120346466 isoform X1 n=1 Tax=Styela clava TaxID=7725 RepID=UPI00193A5F27|nr:uncharacterized protein LOC120346466 isoform X1 [Styela clava]XP_039272144.1 uncharacterized protein LOC120346466 isoform X2 [Styela clava]
MAKRPPLVLTVTKAKYCVSLEFSSNGTMKCVSKNQVCDGIQQCPDNQDEIFCDIMRERPTANCTKNSNLNRFIRNRNRNNSKRMKKIRERHNATISCMTLANVNSVNNVRKKEWGRTGSPHGGYSFSRQSATRMQLLSEVLLQTKTLNNATDNQKNITLSQVCDGIIDCDSAYDELICPGRFYCESGTPLYVNSSQRGDEVADCVDGSDEWEDRPEIMTSSKDKMIKDWYILFSMWVVGIVAVLGNSVVIINTSLSLTRMQNTRSSSAVLQLLSSVTGVILSDSGIKREANLKRDDKGNINQRRTGKSVGWGRKKTIKLWNSVLVLNLAAADFLMGIYLVTLAGISMTQSTDYWNFDKKWRTSGPCQALGVIVMLSSQTSVLSLISLTTLRLYSVARPFGIRILKKSNYLICICAATWIVSFATAVLPILPGLRDHYTTKAWVPFPHARPPVINQTVASNLILALIDVSENTTIGANLLKGEHLSWREMVDLTKQAAPMYSDWRFFGFYSVHSVCIPKLYVTIGDVAWQHTATFLIVNFVGVVYISIAYLFIYILSNKSRAVVFEKAPTRLDESVDGSKNCSPNASIKSVQEGGKGKLWIFWDCFTCHKRRQSNFAPTTPFNDRKNVKKMTQRTSRIQFRIALLIATDCVCWIPICIMGFLKLAGHDIPYVAYTISAVGLLPVNSALNPLLYSSFLNDFRIRFYNTLKKKVVTVHVDK